jgi:hypothetical protein
MLIIQEFLNFYYPFHYIIILFEFLKLIQFIYLF